MRLLKFDSVFPYGYFDRLKESEAARLRAMDYAEYYDWLMAQRLGGSDFLTRPMNKAGWEAREVIAKDTDLIGKLVASGQVQGAAGLSGSLARATDHLLGLTVRELASFRAARHAAKHRRDWILGRYIESFRPDVIFIREPSHIDGKFFDRFRDKALIVSLIGCNTNHAINWDSHRSDVIFTLTKEYLDFFRVQGIETHLFEYGVDERLADDLEGLPKEHACTFVGFLGQPWQSRKTELMEQVASAVDFKWWGLKGDDIGRYPALLSTYQGEAAGMEMFRIYRQSAIVLNDYVDTAAGQNVNIRTKEVLGTESVLLTREADNIRDLEKQGALVTFKNAEDCLTKIRGLLSSAGMRRQIAARGYQVAREKFSYQLIAERLMEFISAAYEKKRSALQGWGK